MPNKVDVHISQKSILSQPEKTFFIFGQFLPIFESVE